MFNLTNVGMLFTQSYGGQFRDFQGYGGQWLILYGAETLFEIDLGLIMYDLSLQISIKHFHVLVTGLGPLGYEEIN